MNDDTTPEGHENNPHETGGEGDDGAPRPIPQPHGGALLPFVPGDPRAAKGRDRALQVRREHRVLREQKETDLRKLMAGYVDCFPRDDLGKNAAALANVLIAQVAAREIKVRNGAEAAELLKVLTDIARIEAGEPTTVALHATMNSAETLERIKELQARARESLRSGVIESASADGPAVGDVGQ